MDFSWDINLSTIIAIAALILSQYGMHRKNLQTLIIIKYRVGMMWNAYLRDHNLPNGDVE